jgi:4-amino-4-deoxy-L-arabinose transferase-like glycosyltransferase
MLQRLKRHWPWLGIIVLAVALRAPLLFGLGTLWNDEAFSRHFALLPIKDALRYLTMDVHPPLHTVVLHFWMKAFGDTALAMRSLSLIFAVAGLAVFLKLARALFGRREALLAGLLAVISPLMVYYGADARMYAMVFFLSCLSTLLFWKALEGDERATEAWMWVSLALTLTHLTGALVMAGQALFLLISAERRPFFWKFLWRFVVIALVFAVWLVPAATFRLSSLSKEWQFRSGQEDLHASLSLLYWIWLGKNTIQLAIAFAATGILMLGGLLRKTDRRPFFNISRESALLFCWFACAFAPFLVFPNVTPRYLISAVPPFFLLVARGFLQAAGNRRLALAFGAALILFLALPGLAVQYAVRSYNWDRTAAWIKERERPQDRVVFGWFADSLAIEGLDDPTLAAVAEDAHGLYPFDDDFDVHARLSAHAGTLAIAKSDLDRMEPYFKGAERVFFIPNFYLTLREGGTADDAVAEWINARGWFLADHLPPEGRTQGVWLLVRKEK